MLVQRREPGFSGGERREVEVSLETRRKRGAKRRWRSGGVEERDERGKTSPKELWEWQKAG